MPPRIDLYTLRLFVSAAHEGSIARAAQNEHIAPSALSRRIAHLEHVLGLPLIIRSPRGIELTEAGRVVFDGGMKIDSDLDQLARAVQQQAGQTSGTLRVFANATAIIEFLPQRLQEFRARYPLVEIELRERTTADVVRACVEDRADIGIAVRTDVSGATETWVLAEERLTVVMPADHQLAKKRQVRFTKALEFPMIGMMVGDSLDQLLQERAMGAAHPLRVVASVNSFDSIHRLVRSGLGIAIVPSLDVARSHAPDDRLVDRPLNEPWAARELCLYALRKRPRPRSVEAMISMLTAGASNS
jgi:DNA-binding transcriptional LysR family regulator